MTTIEKLIDKSKEAFLLAIEIYNKPSIRYRVEGFSFFICNAWELMLKAHLINTRSDSSIYYKDNPKRTISLENCIELIFTNNKDPLRRNLEKIIDLRNTSTHFIVEEYEMVYIPLFQACVFNYIDKMQEFHNFDIAQMLPQNFLTLSVNISTINADEIRAKYPPEIADRLHSANDALRPIIGESNNRFAIRVDHHYYITKDRNKASAVVAINSQADSEIKIVKELKDPNATHSYTCKSCCAEINTRLKRDGIEIKFNAIHFRDFCQYYGIKENPAFCYTYKIQTNPQFSYSRQAIDFIVSEIKKDPEHIIQNIRDHLRKKGS